MAAARSDALVVGGSIHDRLALRTSLRDRGYRVTVTRTVRSGLAQLRRHDFAVCAVDLSNEPRRREWRWQFQHASAARGTDLTLSG